MTGQDGSDRENFITHVIDLYPNHAARLLFI
jgi:hypothetical protein